MSSTGEPSEPSWSDVAGWYDELLVAGSGPHETATACLLGLVGNMRGRVILDVACGQGIATRALTKAGAGKVVGVDIWPEMVDLAQARTDPDLPITYRRDDGQTLATCKDNEFDGVTCQLGLMDIPDLDTTLESVHRVLRPGGWFVFVIGHPCFLSPHTATLTDNQGRLGLFVHDYRHERFWRSPNPGGVRRVGNYHRTLSTYFNALRRADFTVEEVREPPAGSLLAKQQPVYVELPIFLAIRAVAGPTPKPHDGRSVKGQPLG